jgi:hypothetical protein
VTLLEEAEFRRSIDALCARIAALPLDDAWLDRIREVAVRVVGAVADAGGDWFTSQTFDAIILDAYAAIGDRSEQSPGEANGRTSAPACVPKADGEPNPEPEIARRPLVQAQRRI